MAGGYAEALIVEWLGGQLTVQGVPPDEHPWIEQFGCTASYRAFREGVRAYYRGVAGLAVGLVLRSRPVVPDEQVLDDAWDAIRGAW